MTTDMIGAIGMLTILVLVFIFHIYKTKKTNTDSVDLDKGHWIDFSDDLKSTMSTIMQCELSYADQYLARYLIYKYIDYKMTVNGRKIDSNSVQIKFMLKAYKDGRQEIHAMTESHYGTPTWHDNTLYHDYDIGEKTFIAPVDDFSTLWSDIINHYYGVQLDGTTVIKYKNH